MVAVTLVLAGAACTSTPAPRADRTTSKPTTAPSSPTASATPSSEAPTSAVIRSNGGSLLVRGTYPRVASRCVRYHRPRLAARYPGTLSVKRSDDGTLALTVTLPFEDYLKGIAEVPPSWPRAALEAQAIAARSYALATTGWEGAEGEALKTPICATTSCQVYRGIPVPFDPNVRRWFAAVRRTSGEVLLYGDRPAETVYFSTSNGRTYGNDEVFGSAPLPYLRPVVEHDDGASPLSHWRVRVPFADLATFLHEAGEWPPHRTVSGVGLAGSTVTVQGEGASRSIDLTTFRDAVNVWGPCLKPGRYPPSPLPVTLPSRWMTLSSNGDAAVAVGTRLGARRRDGAVGCVRQGAPRALGLGYPRLLLRGAAAADLSRTRPDPRPGRERPHLDPRRAVPTRATLDGEELGSERVTITGGDELTVTTRP